MVKKTTLSICCLLILFLLSANVSYGEVIRVRIIIEKGSVWESEAGKRQIQQAANEARRIWFAGVGVPLHLPQNYTTIPGSSDNELTEQDIKSYATTHKAAARDIVVIMRNKSFSRSRAWTESALVASDTPVIIIGRQVFDKPGTNRDLAHELGHVLLRDETHSPGYNDLMNITHAPNNGDTIRTEQADKAKKYPLK